MLLLLEPYLGEPYYWGGNKPPTFDCSGMVQWAAGQLGISLPHWTKSQWEIGVQVPRAEAKPGTLIFFENTYDMKAVHGDWVQPPFISHVGIYAGDDNMLDANSERGVVVESIETPYWQSHLYGFRDITRLL